MICITKTSRVATKNIYFFGENIQHKNSTNVKSIVISGIVSKTAVGYDNSMTEELYKKSACDVVDLIRAGDISNFEVLESAKNRIEDVDNRINALPIKCFELALEKLSKLDLVQHKLNPKSLCGLPIAVKDYNDVKGVPTTYGSQIFKSNIAKKSDATVKLLEQNGAIPIAKSNVPEWAGGNTFNTVFGLTRNPWNTSKTAGGSSGGSSAALASGQVWLATGNDLGGSLRIPASFNSIVGLRPSPGLVPRGARYPSFDCLWVEGPLARSVEDVALMMDAETGFSKEDPLSFKHHCSSFRQSLTNYKLPNRIAFSEDLNVVPVEKEIRSVIKLAEKKITGMGIATSDFVPNFNDSISAFATLRAVLLSTMMDKILKRFPNQINTDVKKNIELGYDQSSKDIIAAEQVRWQLSQAMTNFFKTHDFLICPSTSVLPFEASEHFVTEIDGRPCKTYIDWCAITFALTLTACPIINLPFSYSQEGLPIGIQIVGQPRQEDRLLAFAYCLENEIDLKKNLPIDPISPK